jgi:hypothetical protein
MVEWHVLHNNLECVIQALDLLHQANIALEKLGNWAREASLTFRS